MWRVLQETKSHVVRRRKQKKLLLETIFSCYLFATLVALASAAVVVVDVDDDGLERR